jgi:hypothetical protein
VCQLTDYHAHLYKKPRHRGFLYKCAVLQTIGPERVKIWSDEVILWLKTTHIMYRLLCPIFLVLVLSCKPESGPVMPSAPVVSVVTPTPPAAVTVASPAALSAATTLLRAMTSTEYYIPYNGIPQLVTGSIKLTFDADCRPKRRVEIYVERGLAYNMTQNDYEYDAQGFLLRESVQFRKYPASPLESSSRYFTYDKVGRLISVRMEITSIASQSPAYRDVYEYKDAARQINQYHCGLDSTNCVLKAIYTNGQQTFPAIDPAQKSTTNYVVTPYNGVNRKTYNQDGQLTEVEASEDYGKRLASRTTYEYDDKPLPPFTVPDTYFKGFPQVKANQTKHNLISIVRVSFDTAGAETERVEGTANYTYNADGNPLTTTFREYHKTLKVDTGATHDIAYTYGCQ